MIRRRPKLRPMKRAEIEMLRRKRGLCDCPDCCRQQPWRLALKRGNVREIQKALNARADEGGEK